jgi:hypothetical protein
MRRLALACAIVVGLAIGSGVRTSAIGLTQVTLSCDDGTTTALVVDADTLTGLVQGVQAMIDYPRRCQYRRYRSGFSGPESVHRWRRPVGRCLRGGFSAPL